MGRFDIMVIQLSRRFKIDNFWKLLNSLQILQISLKLGVKHFSILQLDFSFTENIYCFIL